MAPNEPTMKAAVLPDFGAAPEMRQVPVPRPAEGEVRVRLHAASVNGFDVSVARGRLEGMMEHRFPVVLGKDFAGTVEALGAGGRRSAPRTRTASTRSCTSPAIPAACFPSCARVAASPRRSS